MGHELPTHPTLFAKFREALIGARDDIVLPASSDQVDWEAELALVIGTRVRHASTEAAAAAIAGFTVANDVLDARLAVPLARVPAGQDVGARHAGRSVAGDAGRGRRHRARSRDPLRGRRRRAPGEPHLAAGVLVGRPGRLRQRVRHPRARRPHPHRHAGGGGTRHAPARLPPGRTRWSARSSNTSASSRTVAVPRPRDLAGDTCRSSYQLAAVSADTSSVDPQPVAVRPEDLGARLRAVRELSGVSTRDVARSAGLGTRELRAAERGAKRLSPDQLHALAGALSVDPDVLVGVGFEGELVRAGSVDDRIDSFVGHDPDHWDDFPLTVDDLPPALPVNLPDVERRRDHHDPRPHRGIVARPPRRPGRCPLELRAPDLGGLGRRCPPASRATRKRPDEAARAALVPPPPREPRTRGAASTAAPPPRRTNGHWRPAPTSRRPAAIRCRWRRPPSRPATP